MTTNEFRCIQCGQEIEDTPEARKYYECPACKSKGEAEALDDDTRSRILDEVAASGLGTTLQGMAQRGLGERLLQDALK